MTLKKIQIKLKLVKPARSYGGDRYEGKHEKDSITLYFPQSISRATGGIPAQELMVEVSHG